MLDFFRNIFLVEFEGTGKKRKDFFFYQFMIIFSIFSLFLMIFLLEFFLNVLEINYCFTWELCFWHEKIIWDKVEIFNNILFLMILCFGFRFNSINVDRYSFFWLFWFSEKYFLIVFSVLKIFFLSLIIYYSLNFLFYFYWQNYYSFLDILTEAKNVTWNFVLIYFLAWLELFLFFLWLFYNKKHK